MKTIVLFFVAVLLTTTTFSQTVPELIFRNPVLESGVAGQDGAIYRFSNVSTNPNLDALVKIMGRSDSTVVLNNIDVTSSGFDKAFQPELGIPGTANANTSWWMKFQIRFVSAGTNTLKTIDKFSATAIDIDGDGVSIAENLTMNSAISVDYSPSTVLVHSAPIAVMCPHHHIASLPMICPDCLGLGYTINGGGHLKACDWCNSTGWLFSACGDAFTGTDFSANGPVANSADIDTMAVNNMATYNYTSTNTFTFTYGATNGASSSTAGMRLNSIWFKQFDLTPMSTLPVTLTSFTAILEKNNKVDLNWATATEINLSHFTIERSMDGINFSDAGLVFAYGTNGAADYAYTDNLDATVSGVIYYRLASVDNDGKTKYSDTRIIRIGKATDNAVTILTYPNPASNEVRITIPASWQNKKVLYTLYNSNGQVAKQSAAANSGQTETLDISNLAPGFYIVDVNCAGVTAQQKIVKQ